MGWLAGGLVLVVAAFMLRRLLDISAQNPRRCAGLLPLSAERQKHYEPLAREIETQDAILGISLNDAFEERDRGNAEIAWRLIRLTLSEWDRQQEILTGLLNAILAHLGALSVVVPLRSLSSYEFKSAVMKDFVRMHELLDQLVYRTKLRFQLRIRVLRRATAALTSEFRRAYRYGEGPDGQPPELWRRLDLLYHDFDLVTKESLLAYRTYLFCLPHSTLAAFAADLERFTHHVARVLSVREGE
ncbi:MAG: hypothetical protein DMG22_01210 [Acidobacteria bacterium]|nr:MAG: hypothetical protein DMG22_01210 [Acidobacteriota bacterium]